MFYCNDAYSAGYEHAMTHKDNLEWSGVFGVLDQLHVREIGQSLFVGLDGRCLLEDNMRELHLSA